jgi:hypothetical protein
LYRKDLRRFLDTFRRETRDAKSCIRGKLEAYPTRESELPSDSQLTARMNHGTCVHVRSSGDVNQRKSAKKERESGESAK